MDARERLEAARRRVVDAEAALASARSSLRAEIVKAHRAGVSQSEIGRIVGISRQRVKQLIELD
jgi:DNA-directed RNA polymerase specialized sigma24 family protein